MKAIPMKQAKTKDGIRYSQCDPKEATHIKLNYPGPIPFRMIPVNGGELTKQPWWHWNGDVEKPTLSPSILTRWPHKNKEEVCHSFLKDGKVQFLGDCTHDLAGKTVDLPDVDV